MTFKTIYDLKNVQGLIMKIGKSSGANYQFFKLKSVIDFYGAQLVTIGTKSVSINTLDWI